MKKRVLFVATVVKTHIMVFHLPYLKMFKEKGYETAVAAKNDYDDPNECNIPYCDKFYDIPFERSPFAFRNYNAYRMLKSIVKNENYDIIHCHTPVGGVIGRLTARTAREKGTKVFYTAHGFHFYKGAPLINWLLYYPVEKFCAYFTDVLITINQEDYSLAYRKLKAKRIYYVPGVGIDTRKFADTVNEKTAKRDEIGVPGDAFMILSVGELNKNKNHAAVIRAIAGLGDEKIHYGIAGKGKLREKLIALSNKMGVGGQVHFLGYRSDIPKLYKCADLCVFPSIREGLPVALMEAMASGLPIVCSRIRGNTDLVDENGGILYEPNDINELKTAITDMIKNDSSVFGGYNLEKSRNYDVNNINAVMEKIYFGNLNE